MVIKFSDFNRKSFIFWIFVFFFFFGFLGFSHILSDSSVFSPFLSVLSYSLVFLRVLSDFPGFSYIPFRILWEFGQILLYYLWFFQIFQDSLAFSWIPIPIPILPDSLRIYRNLFEFSHVRSYFPDSFRILSDFVEFSRIILELCRMLNPDSI